MQASNIESRTRRVLIPIVGQGSIIHIIRTGMLDSIKEFCEPVIGLMWHQEDLIKELKDKGYEISFIPKYAVSPEYALLRSKIDMCYRMQRVKTPSVLIQKNYLAQFKKKNFKSYKKSLKEKILKLQIRLRPGYSTRLLQREKQLIHDQVCINNFEAWLKDLRIEGLFTVTPFLNEVDLIARILRRKNIPLIASIHSFDNVTKRGWASTFFDHYIVWNKYNKSELERINPSLKENNAITIAGAPQFDFHFNEKYTWTKEEWLLRLGLPSNKKIILYSGGPVSLLPDEPQYLQHLKEAFDNNLISEENIILFRCHPLDRKERWINYVGKSRHIIYDTAPGGEKKLDYVNVVEDDIKKLMSTLKYSDVHVNVISTMSVDGSAFKKPQIGPYYDSVHPATQNLFRQMYFQEHFVPIIKSKVVNLAHSKQEFIRTVKQALDHPEQYNQHSEACLKEIVEYTDGKSAKRAVEAIKTFFRK